MVNVCGEERVLYLLESHFRLRHKKSTTCNVVIDIIYFLQCFEYLMHKQELQHLKCGCSVESCDLAGKKRKEMSGYGKTLE